MIGSDFHFSASMADRTIGVSFYATEADSGVACSEAFTTLRTALHAIGSTNHPWPGYQPTFRTVRKLQDA